MSLGTVIFCFFVSCMLFTAGEIMEAVKTMRFVEDYATVEDLQDCEIRADLKRFKVVKIKKEKMSLHVENHFERWKRKRAA